MNQYLFLHRIQGPAMLLTFGVTALLDQWHILSFGKSWPLYLIVLGVLKLAQRAALANAEPPAYPGYPSPAGATPPPAPPSTSLVPADAGSGEMTGPRDENEFGDRR
jgi:cell wall-active antibiotic response 4TMS protein YvqF